MTPTCLLEARIVLVARRDDRSINDLDLWLLKAGVEVMPIDADLVDFATQACSPSARGAISDVAAMTAADPPGVADLAWAPFPYQDLLGRRWSRTQRSAVGNVL